MRRFPPLVLTVAACLALAGCGIPDAIAYGVKAAKGNGGSPASAHPTAAAYQTPAPTPLDPEPASMPMPVQREAIQVEQLPPPSVMR